MNPSGWLFCIGLGTGLISTCGVKGQDPPRMPLAGVCTHFAIRPGDFARARPALTGLGLASFRDEAYWSHLERSKGVLVFPPRLKAAYQDLARAGLRPLIALGYGNPLYDQGGKPVSAEARAAFAAYCRFVASELKDCDPIFEIWNEWDGGRQPGTVRDYLDLVLPSARAIREAAPRALILMGSLTSAGIDRKWHLSLLDPRVLPLVDGISIHPYVQIGRGAADPPQTLCRWVDALCRELDRDPGGAKLGVYVTEIGWSAFAGRWGVSESRKAGFLSRTFKGLSLIPKVKGVWWYDFMNDGADPREYEHHFGLVDQNAQPLPAYWALRDCCSGGAEKP